MKAGQTSRRFDLNRPVHWPSLALDFAICVVVWVIGVLVQGAHVSRAGAIASVGTATTLTGVSWLLAKLNIPDRDDED